MSTSCYREFLPSTPDPYIACFWSQTIATGAGDFLQRVLPDGCVDIIWINGVAARVVGPATRPFVERLSGGTRVTGIRFRPGAAAAVLNVDATELRNLQTELAAVVGCRVARQFDPTSLERLEQAMRTYLATRPAVDPIAAALVSAIDARLDGPVRGLVARIGLSERQVRRRFRQAVGYGLKPFQRIARLRRLREWAAASGRRSRSLSALAYDLGYADQAHLTREITALAGMPPGRFIRIAPTIQMVSDDRNLQDGHAIAR